MCQYRSYFASALNLSPAQLKGHEAHLEITLPDPNIDLKFPKSQLVHRHEYELHEKKLHEIAEMKQHIRDNLTDNEDDHDEKDDDDDDASPEQKESNPKNTLPPIDDIQIQVSPSELEIEMYINSGVSPIDKISREKEARARVVSKKRARSDDGEAEQARQAIIDAMTKAFKEIMAKYVAKQAEFEINIPHSTRKKLIRIQNNRRWKTTATAEMQVKVFDECIQQIVSLMRDSFHRFVRDEEVYSKCVHFILTERSGLNQKLDDKIVEEEIGDENEDIPEHL